VIFVRVTGGMSRAVGGLCALDAGAEVCGIKPVRTMGGCRRVDMARMLLVAERPGEIVILTILARFT
jgi:hypothetical protein